MNPVSAFAYAQARLQARLGARPAETDWDRLHALDSLPAWLEQARATPLRHWLTNLGSTTPPHEIERLLRAHFRRLTDDVARWLPPPWRPAVRWIEIVPDLPALAHLLRGEPAHDWMHEEPALRAVAESEPALRARALARGSWAALAAARPGAGTLFDSWLAEWRRRQPDDRRARVRFGRLTGVLQAHREAFLRLAPAQSDTARRALEARLAHLFRRAFLTSAAAVAWLLLAALELERVRGALLTRALFPPAGR